MTSGTDGTSAEPWQQLVYGGYVYINVTDTPLGAATDTWYKFQLTLVS